MTYDFDHTLNHRINQSYRWGMKEFPSDVIGMGTADLDYTCAPCIRDVLVPIAEENCYNYRQHTDHYYEMLMHWYESRYGLQTEASWFSNVPSTIGAIRIALDLFAGRDAGVIVQTPVFQPVQWAIEGAGCRLVENPMKIINGHYELDLDDFERKIQRQSVDVFVLINPHNPTGRVFTREELEQLVEICDRNGVKIISDEVHSLVLHGDAKHIPVLAINETAKRISMQVVSLSKGFNIMSLPHAIITIADEEMREKWMEQIKAYSFGYAVNSFAIAAVTAILEGKADDWMEEMTSYLEENLKEIFSFIEKRNLPVHAFRPEAGFLLWIDVHDAGIGEEHLDKFFMDQAHIHLDDGEENFGLEGRGFIRINIAVTKEVLKETLNRIDGIIRSRRESEHA